MSLQGKVALVTGASSGLGRSFAESLAKAGCHVGLLARRVDRLNEVKIHLQNMHNNSQEKRNYAVVPLDVKDTKSIPIAINRVVEELGDIDILVNNSGVATQQPIVDISEEDYDHVMNTNVKGAYFVAKSVGNLMLKRSIRMKSEGLPYPHQRIINIASVAGMRPVPGVSAYCMSKAAVIHMTKTMAVEWKNYGINVNTISPGYIKTEINDEYLESDAGKKLLKVLPRQRFGEPHHLEALLLILASEESEFINAANINADDGFASF